MTIWICGSADVEQQIGPLVIRGDGNTCPNCREVTEEKIHALLQECYRIERHIATNVPHLEPASGSMSVAKIRSILRGSTS